MSEFSKLLLYVPGIVIFLVGSGRIKEYLRLRRKNAVVGATVTECKRIVKKDKQDRTTFDYYNVTASYRNPVTNRKDEVTVKSAVEFLPGQAVAIYLGSKGEVPVIADSEDESVFNPFVTMIIGALLILLALFDDRGEQVPAMACLALVMIIAGATLIVHNVMLKKRDLKPVEATVTDVFKRQISKETKLMRGSKYTYYPIVRYTIDGQEGIRRCDTNSSREDAYKPGTAITLYYDAAKRLILEKKDSNVALAAGVIILILGLLAGASILSAIGA
jgi:hypothetical protein